ncbi:MAG: CBS domain-containing protein [Geodermatophilaceae bacterium]|nr:CBS domain-containing protein [Geodermatophilaceae bacterium]
MRARDLAVPFPAVGLDDDALTAARLMADRKMPGIVVCHGDGSPHTILPGSQVLRFVIPRYVQDDDALARVIDEQAADDMFAGLAGKRVRDLLPKEKRELPVVKGGDTVMEVAALMARAHSPLVAVVESGRLLGCVTVADLLERYLPGPET